MSKIDARGLSCPGPVVLASRAMASGENTYEIIVDDSVSKENVTRFAEQLGYRVNVAEADGEYTLTITK